MSDGLPSAHLTTVGNGVQRVADVQAQRRYIAWRYTDAFIGSFGQIIHQVSPRAISIIDIDPWTSGLQTLTNHHVSVVQVDQQQGIWAQRRTSRPRRYGCRPLLLLRNAKCVRLTAS